MSNLETFAEYKVGDTDKRPWGQYVVTSVGTNDNGEEVCEKDITVMPKKILSLQSHKHRRERWTILNGTLTVVLNDKLITLQKGQSIDIPLHAIHCMANLSDQECIVHEVQEGLCREEDIIRYVDSYGRATESPANSNTQDSITLYNNIIREIEK